MQQKAKHGYITNIVTLKGKCNRVVHKATWYHLPYNFSVPYYFHRWKVQLYSLPSLLPRTADAWGTLPSLAVITCLEQLCVNCLPLRSLAVFIKVKWTLLSDEVTFFFSVSDSYFLFFSIYYSRSHWGVLEGTAMHKLVRYYVGLHTGS